MKYKYQVTLSFAGEDRPYVEQVVSCLIAKGVEVFYDKFEESELWGKDLYEHFDNIYRNESRYCVMFLSKHYSNKVWTNHERKSAQARSLQQSDEYILPIKLDDTEIPGIRPTTAYLDGSVLIPDKVCAAIIKKLDNKSPSESGREGDNLQDISIPKIKRAISDLEKKQFLKTSFAEIMNYFDKGLIQFKYANSHIETDFEKITDSKFVASVYVDGQLKNQCKIWTETGRFGSSLSISYSEGSFGLDSSNDNAMNDSARITDDGFEIFFDVLGIAFGFNINGLENINLKHASTIDVAKYYWGRFIRILNY